MSGNGQLVELLQGSWVAFGRATQSEGLSRLAVGWKPGSSAGRRASKGWQILDFGRRGSSRSVEGVSFILRGGLWFGDRTTLRFNGLGEPGSDCGRRE